ncbi:MAG: MerR family DNA-binding transcriptional regulator [Chlamydiae bacterium]|nr:MerR family DNA-binding transcriptional regulator [Chlamydiota bacterium]
MNRFIKVGKAAEFLGVSIQTLRRWELAGILLPHKKTKGMTRYYDKNKLLGLKIQETDLTIAYARVSSHDQKEDLTR